MTNQSWWRPTDALDATRMGGQNYTQAEVRAITAAIHPATHHRPLNVATIWKTTGVPGRTIRRIVSDLDGKWFKVGKRPGGLFICRYEDEAESYSRGLERHWRSERVRCWRRGRFELPRRQGLLFDDADFEDDDDEDEEDDE